MADIDSLAAALFGSKRAETQEVLTDATTRTYTGTAVTDSENGTVIVDLGGDVTLPDDIEGLAEYSADGVEVATGPGVRAGDEVVVTLVGGTPLKTPMVTGVAGEGDRQDERIHAIEADYVKASTLEADVADVGFLKADSAAIKDLQADAAKVHDLTADQLSAATAYIASLKAKSVTAETLAADVAKVHDLTADQLSAAAAYIAQLAADSVTAQRIAAISGDFDTVRANAAKVANLTAAELEADHATIGSLGSNFAHITNGVIDNAKIGYADVNNLSAHYAEIQNGHIDSALIDTAAIVDEQVFTVTGNKATLAQIDASKINVLNLKAKDIEVERINGQPVTNKTLVDALSQHETDISDLDTKIDNEVEALNDRIDDAIETFTGTVVPTLSNTPASSWNTTKLKDQHVGDVYYVVNSQSAQNGYCYRFTKSGSTYSWQLIKDSDVTAALSRLQTAEGKIGDIEQFDVTVGSFMTDTDDEISSLKTKTTSLETSLGDKVDTSTFNTVSQKVDANEANITSMSTVLTNNGLTSSTNITNTVNTVRQTAETNTSNISSLQTTVNGHTTTIGQHTTAIQQNSDAIALRATKTEVQQIRPAYATSTTGAGTAAKVATIDPAVTGYALYKGASVAVTFSTANTAATPTLNVNGTGAKQIRSHTGAALSEGEYKWAAGATVDLVYDGTYWRMQDGGAVKRVTAAEASIRVNADNIESKVSKDGVISSINQSAETVKIDASKVEIDGTAVFSAISSDVDDAITSKGYQTSSQVNSAITSKGYATTTQAQGYASTAKSEAISAAATDATTKANAAEANAKAYTDALEIGGRNLFVSSLASNGCPTDKAVGTQYGITGMSANHEAYQLVPVEEGASYIFQYWVDDSEYQGWVCIQLLDADGLVVSKLARVYPQADYWTKAFTVPSGVTTALISGRHLAAGYEYAKLKFEKGTKPTDWTPAPEDVAADIAAAQATADAAAPKSNAVKRTQRIWYRKSASGAPSTPGTASSNWVTKADDGNDAWTKMHIAISSTHKYIYTCEQYEMANGTVGYTSVLLDNTITVIDGGNIITGTVTANKLNAADINASKSLTVGAMTDAAASTILNSNVVVGGRNLFLNSGSATLSGTANQNNLYTTNLTVSEFVPAGTVVTVSCQIDATNLVWGSSGSKRAGVEFSVGSSPYQYIGAWAGAALSERANVVKVVTGTWSGRISKTVTLQYDLPLGRPYAVYVQMLGSGTCMVSKPKLEIGNKATDWSPAPEDMATAESLAGTNESLEGAIADIGELSDQLVDTTTEQNKTITDIQKYLNSLRQDLDAEIQSRQQWLNFNSAEGLIIGATGSTFKTVTTNTSQQFRSGGTVLAETSGMEFVAPVMRSDQILIGNWMWTRRDNGNLSLKWIG